MSWLDDLKKEKQSSHKTENRKFETVRLLLGFTQISASELGGMEKLLKERLKDELRGLLV